MKSKDFLSEGFIEDASDVHMDHEVQMAREECYHAAEHALAIHKLLRNISEQQGLEGWVSSKITLANDYLNTVREHLEYELLQPQIDDVAIGMPIAENEQQGVAEGKRADRYHIVGKDGKPVNLASYADRASAIKDRDEKYPGAVVQQVGPRGKIKGVAEDQLDEIDIDTLNQLASNAVNTMGQSGANFAAGATGGLVGGAIAGGTKKAVDWYYKQKQKKAEAERKKSQQQGVAEGAKCNHTMEGENCPVHGLQECPGMKARALAEWRKAERAKRDFNTVNETTAGSVAGVVNPKSDKPKSKIGSLFGGTYKQRKKKA